jgi:hypothetical protein
MTTAATLDAAGGISAHYEPHPTTSPNIAAPMTTAATLDAAGGISARKEPHPTTFPNVAAPTAIAAMLDAAAVSSNDGIVQCSASGADAESTINKQPSSSKVDNNPSTCKALEYNCAYDVTLKKTIDGYML